MLKNIVIAVLVLCLAGICIFQGWYITDVFTDLENITEDLKLEAEAGNYQAALGVYEKLMRRWDKHLTVLSIFLIHDEVDNVSEELENIGAQLREENELLLPSSIARLTYYLGHIRDGDAFCVENIF